MSTADVLIVGAGPVGMALALALRGQGVASRLVEARDKSATARDRRVLALSHGSRQILERLGVWDGLEATPIETIHVSQAGGFGRTLLRNVDYRVPALGYVVDAGRLAITLQTQVEQFGIAVHYDAPVEDIVDEGGRTAARFRNRDLPPLHAKLIAFAEGAIAAEGDKTVTHDYGQQAIVVNAVPRHAHHYLAYERFTAGGPVALLPHGAAYAAIIVRPTNEAQSLLDLSDDGLMRWLTDRTGNRVSFESVGSRAAFPLQLRFRRAPVGQRRVWLGNAAQTLHPVAGQGFNLALRDAWELSQRLREARDPGESSVLGGYAASRRLDRRGTIGFTDGLIRIFANKNPLLHHVRGTGLFLLDLIPAGRDFVAQRMLFGARAWV